MRVHARETVEHEKKRAEREEEKPGRWEGNGEKERRKAVEARGVREQLERIVFTRGMTG